MSRIRTAACGLLGLLAGGCPPVSDPAQPVTAKISISSTRGSAPLRVFVSGAESSSVNGEITGYAWDFGGQARADTAEATHLFAAPGRYLVTLTVTDEADQSASATVEVRVAGEDEPTAVIVADVTSGPAPLSVQFDGTESSAADDTISDYFWDFGDGFESRRPAPAHTYFASGTFEVRLRVVTGGGLEGSTTTTIVVGGGSRSLQFNGGQRATLPLNAGAALDAFTFEAWFKADAGGELASLGAAFKLEILPDDDLIRVTVGEAVHEVAAGDLGDAWRHVAVAGDSQTELEVYLDGEAFATLAAPAAVESADLIAGRGFRGNLAELRLWSAQRSAAEIGQSFDRRLSGNEAGLLGNWPMNEGAGQTVSNRAVSGVDGLLGDSAAPEAADPAWSNDGPPLP